LDYYEGNGVTGLELQSVDEVSGVYQVNFDYQGNLIPIFVTKDGKYSGSLSPLENINSNSNSNSGNNQQQTDVPKSDKPEVELFVWGYCPYGVQAQGPLAEVVSLLGDYADFKAVLYYDGHGAFETQQNKIQECIQKVAPDKYWDYAAGFVEDIYPECSSSRDVACDKTKAVTLMNSLGIDSNAVLACVDSQGEDLIAAASGRASELGVTGSPTLVVNGVKTSPSSRTAEAFKDVICSAFNNAPEACGETLSSDTGTTSGSC